MSRRLKQVGVVLVVVFAAAQFVRPERANPATDPSRAIEANAHTAGGLVPILDRSCGDCHSNGTMWPWYSRVAPLSWLMSYAVTEGRKAVNFSEWSAYSAEQQQMLLALSCQDASEGRMPGSYALLRPETKLSSQDVATICAAAHRPDAQAAGGR